MRTPFLIPTLACCAAATMLIAGVAAQESRPAFDVVSIKESPPPTPGPGGSISFSMGIGPRPGGRWIAQFSTVLQLMQESYGGFRLPGQIAGAPEWASRTRFEVNAIAATDASPATMNEMVKAMLADRFKLKVRIEKRELDVYALVLARSDGRLGPGLKPSTVDCEAVAKEGKPFVRPAPGERPQCGSMQSNNPNGTTRYMAGSSTVDSVAGVAQRAAGRPVVDRTGLTGRFDIDLEYAGEPRRGVAGQAVLPDVAAASIFTALQEQLGLKLESGKEKMDVLVIEDVHLPTAD
jgi:uncharacterized protein (TIGR03435 family)